jgi:multicomponent Na+:H+ antiporter subunit E
MIRINDMNLVSGAYARKPWIQRFVLFLVCFLFWLALVWPVSLVDGRLLWADIGAGVVVSVFVALVMREFVRVNFVRFLNPVCWFWVFIYTFVFSYYVLKGGFDVAFRVLHPAMPIKPGIVKIRSVLQTETGRTALANSITLTPGTLTIEVTDDGVFYVHWLYVSTLDEEEVAQQVLRRFEWFIARIFERGYWHGMEHDD